MQPNPPARQPEWLVGWLRGSPKPHIRDTVQPSLVKIYARMQGNSRRQAKKEKRLTFGCIGRLLPFPAHILQKTGLE